MPNRFFPAALSFLLFACAAHHPSGTVSTASKNGGPVRVALFAESRTLAPEGKDSDDRSREILAGELHRTSGHNVIVIRKTFTPDRSSLEIEAAEQDASAVLILRHATGSPNSFITAVLRSLETDALIAETAIHRGTTTENIDAVRTWYESVAEKLSAIPPLSHLNLMKRLAAENRCPDLLALASRHEFAPSDGQNEVETITEVCRRKTDSNSPAPGTPLHIRTENVEAHFQAAFFGRIGTSRLVAELQTHYRQSGELWISCSDDCTQGRIRLSMPYDPNGYRAQKPDRAQPLAPYLRLAAALIEYRSSLKNVVAISKFPIEILLTSPTSELKIDVQATGGKPRLTSKSDVLEFLRLDR